MGLPRCTAQAAAGAFAVGGPRKASEPGQGDVQASGHIGSQDLQLKSSIQFHLRPSCCNLRSGASCRSACSACCLLARLKSPGSKGVAQEVLLHNLGRTRGQAPKGPHARMELAERQLSHLPKTDL